MKDIRICECNDEYSIEEHGSGYALYLGRCPHRHGWNLANMQQIDAPRLDRMLKLLNDAVLAAAGARGG